MEYKNPPKIVMVEKISLARFTQSFDSNSPIKQKKVGHLGLEVNEKLCLRTTLSLQLSHKVQTVMPNHQHVKTRHLNCGHCCVMLVWPGGSEGGAGHEPCSSVEGRNITNTILQCH